MPTLAQMYLHVLDLCADHAIFAMIVDQPHRRHEGFQRVFRFDKCLGQPRVVDDRFDLTAIADNVCVPCLIELTHIEKFH